MSTEYGLGRVISEADKWLLLEQLTHEEIATSAIFSSFRRRREGRGISSCVWTSDHHAQNAKWRTEAREVKPASAQVT